MQNTDLVGVAVFGVGQGLEFVCCTPRRASALIQVLVNWR